MLLIYQEGLIMAKGDHVKVRRTVYAHHGIDIGDGTVVHFTGEPGNKSDAKIRQTSMEDFLHGGELEIVKYKKCNPPNKVIKTALSRKKQEGYNLLNDNCEHFARYCKTGQHESEQVNDAIAGAGAAVGTSLATTGGIAAVSAAGTVGGLSAPGVMTGLAAIGPGGVIGGVTTLSAGPAIIAERMLSKTLKDDKHLPNSEREARKAGRIAGRVGGVASAGATVATISAVGVTACLGAAGITSGLATICGVGGG